MNPIQRINRQIDELKRLKGLGAEGKISHADLKQKIDENGDGRLSGAELKAAGFEDQTLRSELQQRYRQGAAQPTMSLFDETGIDQRIGKLESQRTQLAQKAEKALEGKVESFTRLLFNHFDQNDDGALSIAEIESIDPKELRQLASQFGSSAKDVETILARLQTVAAARKATPDADPATIVLPASHEKDFASGMRYDGDPDDDAITAARKGEQRAKFSAELEAAAGKGPELSKLLGTLKTKGLLDQENLFYLATAAKEHGKATFAAIATQLEAYAASPAQGHLVKASERKEYVRAMLRDIAFPEDINQGEKGTCAATAVQIELARRMPVKYIETATRLAANQAVELLPTAKGEVRRLYPNITYRGDAEDDRSLSARLIQNSLMDLGHQAGEDDSSYVVPSGPMKGRSVFFDSRMSIDTAQGLDEKQALKQAARKFPELGKLDVRVLERLGDGLSEREIEYVGQGFFGNSWNDLALASSDKDSLMRGLDEALARGRKVPIGSEDHAMTVLAKVTEGKRTLYKVASWSGHYSMAQAALRQRLTNVFTDLPVQPPAQVSSQPPVSP